MRLDPARWEALISGQRRGFAARLARGALTLGELPYALAVLWRNRRYDRRPELVQHAPIPVVSIGNLTTGGTGKTPLVAWVARYLRGLDLRVVLLSRGYGAPDGALNDEALELEQRLPDVPHVQQPDRVAAVNLAAEEFASQIAVLDDGFQHRRLARDLDIVLLDALQPFGYGHLLPRGLLREPLKGLRRASMVGLSRADLVNASERQAVRELVARKAPQAAWFELAYRPRLLLSADGQSEPVEQLRRSKCLAFCGIGNPRGFRQTLERAGGQIAELRVFPDHHAYTREDVGELTKWVRTHPECGLVVCTHKDLVKLAVSQLAGVPLRALVIEPEFLEGLAEIEQQLARVAALAPRDAE